MSGSKVTHTQEVHTHTCQRRATMWKCQQAKHQIRVRGERERGVRGGERKERGRREEGEGGERDHRGREACEAVIGLWTVTLDNQTVCVLAFVCVSLHMCVYVCVCVHAHVCLCVVSISCCLPYLITLYSTLVGVGCLFYNM